MNKEMNDLKNRWKEAKEYTEGQTGSVAEIINLARAKRKSSVYFHYGNIAVLTVVLIGVSASFYYFFPFRDLLSKTGVALMVGGLALRILIEIFSTIKFLSIDLTDHALKTTNDTLAFYNFRKKLHGPVTFTIVAIYTIGFYLLTPEFSKYLDLKWMILIDASYVIGAIFLIWQIGRGIRKEMKDLSELVKLKEVFNKEE